jgi:hypothetical protein
MRRHFRFHSNPRVRALPSLLRRGSLSPAAGSALLALAITSVLFGINTAKATAVPASPNYVATPVPAELAAGSRELPDLRRQNSRSYLSPDGDYRALVSSGPINYKDAQNLWQPIDNTLVPENGGFGNSAK